MKKLKPTLLGLGFLLSIGLVAYAQTTITQNLNGTNVILGQNDLGGQSFATTVQALRNATGHLLVATGTTVNTSMTQAQNVLIAQGAITTWNISLPPNPYTGELVRITCPGGTGSTVAVTPNVAPTGTTLVGTAYTGCTSGGAAAGNAEYTYSTSANVWYRIN
jgi:hypothetical protein